MTGHTSNPELDVGSSVGGDLTAVTEEIVSVFRETLERQGSELIRHPEAAAMLDHQVRSVVADVDAAVREVTRPPEADDNMRLFNISIGIDRAQRGIHPSESLRAAVALFDVTLPILVRELAPTNPDQAIRISRALHEAVMSRVALASLSYVSFLLDKLHASRQEERQRIARELHDRVLHTMGLALQSVELYRHYATTDPERANSKLNLLTSSLQEAIATVQHITAELRRLTGNGGIEHALRTYLETNVPPSVCWSLDVTGDASQLAPNISEELYLITREAVRNAIRHASPRHLTVSLTIEATSAVAVVTDDGTGFIVPDKKNTGGLASMRERVLLLRGQLDLTSEPGNGTRVEVRVPLAGSGL